MTRHFFSGSLKRLACGLSPDILSPLHVLEVLDLGGEPLHRAGQPVLTASPPPKKPKSPLAKHARRWFEYLLAPVAFLMRCGPPRAGRLQTSCVAITPRLFGRSRGAWRKAASGVVALACLASWQLAMLSVWTASSVAQSPAPAPKPEPIPPAPVPPPAPDPLPPSPVPPPKPEPIPPAPTPPPKPKPPRPAPKSPAPAPKPGVPKKPRQEKEPPLRPAPLPPPPLPGNPPPPDSPSKPKMPRPAPKPGVPKTPPQKEPPLRPAPLPPPPLPGNPPPP